MAIRAFLSHSSRDAALVDAVYARLEPDALWLDKVDLNWGGLFLERIESGLRNSSDFVLFWSLNAKESTWVRHELHMAFILHLRENAIRIRVVILDDTPLPLTLQPFHFLDVRGADDPVMTVVRAMEEELQIPAAGVRSAFVNRTGELDRIESAIDDPMTKMVVLTGFTGIGKLALVREALSRLFRGVETATVNVSEGTADVELAMILRAEAGRSELPVGLDEEELVADISESVSTIFANGQILLVVGAQHWLNEENEPTGTMLLLLSATRGARHVQKWPIFVTSTRWVRLSPEHRRSTAQIRVQELPDEHMAQIVRRWYELLTGQQLQREQSETTARELLGHPFAARLAAGVLAEKGPDYLERHPAEFIRLRRDLASQLMSEVSLKPPARRLMETLALTGVPLTAEMISDAFSRNYEEVHEAVFECAGAGLIAYSAGCISVHPLVEDYFWSIGLHREDYQSRAAEVASAMLAETRRADPGSTSFVNAVHAAFRLFAIAGRIEDAWQIRSDLHGQLLEAGITLYHRREYPLAKQYLEMVLESDPKHWRARLFLARILIRDEDWAAADSLLDELRGERPSDVGVGQATGWRYERSRDFKRALEAYEAVIAHREHVASLRGAAQCLQRLGRLPEALVYLERAETIESENPYVLDLKAKILEEQERFDEAFDVASIAAIRDPSNWSFHHRLGRIQVQRGNVADAIRHFDKATQLDPTQFTPAHARVSALLDMPGANLVETARLLEQLEGVAKGRREIALVRHLRARHLMIDSRLEDAAQIIEDDLRRGSNLIPNLGLKAEIQLRLHDQLIASSPSVANVHLLRAKDAVTRGLEKEPDNQMLVTAAKKVDDRC